MSLEIKAILLKEVAGRAAKHFADVFLRWLKQNDLTSPTKAPKNFEESLGAHLQEVANWCDDTTDEESNRSRSLTEIFIDPELTDKTPRQGHRMSYKRLLEKGVNKVVFGYPGAGKTTLMKKLCCHLLCDEPETQTQYDFPVRILLRTLRKNESLITRILSDLGAQWDVPASLSGGSNTLLRQQVDLIQDMLCKYNAVIMVDGLDELPPVRQEACRRHLEMLCVKLSNTDVILTARTQTVVGPLRNIASYTICPFTENDVEMFVNKWFESVDRAKAFLAGLSRTPYRGAEVRPLTLTTLCTLYEAYEEIPSPPRDIYKRIVHLYLEKWDRYRGINRPSVYSSFGVDRKREFLSAVAYELMVRGKTPRFTARDLMSAYMGLFKRFSLPAGEDEAQKVIAEVESHNGIVVMSGYDEYEFYHKTIQEYLAADEVVRMPFIHSVAKAVSKSPDVCALSVSLSSKQENQLFTVVTLVSLQTLSPSFWQTFLERLRIESVELPVCVETALVCLEIVRVYVECVHDAGLKKAILDFLLRQKVASSMSLIRDRSQIYRLSDGSVAVTTQHVTRKGKDGVSKPVTYVVDKEYAAVVGL